MSFRRYREKISESSVRSEAAPARLPEKVHQKKEGWFPWCPVTGSAAILLTKVHQPLPDVRRCVTDHHRETRQVFRRLPGVHPAQFRIRVRSQHGKKTGNFPEFLFRYSGSRGVRTWYGEMAGSAACGIISARSDKSRTI